MALQERILFDELPSDKPICSLGTLPLTTFLLSPGDISNFRSNFAILLLRNVVGELTFLKPFQKYGPKHVIHKYTEEMSKKSSVVNLGLVFANESSSEGTVNKI